jgi:hypothetical protein
MKGEELKKNGNPSETERVAIRDAIDVPSNDPDIGAITPSDAFAKPSVMLKHSDKQFLKKLISAAISERLVQVENVRLSDANLATHLSIVFLLSYY